MEATASALRAYLDRILAGHKDCSDRVAEGLEGLGKQLLAKEIVGPAEWGAMRPESIGNLEEQGEHQENRRSLF